MAFNNETKLDETDLNILDELQKNARISYADLGRSVGLSRPGAVERVKRLEKAGVIEGYQVKINLKKAGLPVKAFLRVAASDGKSYQMLDLAEEIPEMLECHRVAGSDDIVAKVVASSIDHLRNVIDQLVDDHRIITEIVLSSAPEKQAIGQIIRPLKN